MWFVSSVVEVAALLVPVFFTLIECREHDGHHGGGILTDQVYDVLIIPKVKSPLSHLKSKQRICV